MVQEFDDIYLEEENDEEIPVAFHSCFERLSTPSFISFEDEYVEVILGKLSKADRRRKACLDKKKASMRPQCLCQFSPYPAHYCQCLRCKDDGKVKEETEPVCPCCKQGFEGICECIPEEAEEVIPECTCVCKCGNMEKGICGCICTCMHEDEFEMEEYEMEVEEETQGSCSCVCLCSASDEKDCRCLCTCQDQEEEGERECMCVCQCDASDEKFCTCVCTCRPKEKQLVESEKSELESIYICKCTGLRKEDKEELIEEEDNKICTCGCHYEQDYSDYFKRGGIGHYEMDEFGHECSCVCECSASNIEDCTCVCTCKRRRFTEMEEARIEEEHVSEESSTVCPCSATAVIRCPCLCTCPSDVKCDKKTCYEQNYLYIKTLNKMFKRLEQVVECKNCVMELNRKIIRENIHLENSEIKKLLYDPKSICLPERPIIEPDEVRIDKYITRLAMPPKIRSHDFKILFRKKYRDSATVCTRIVPALAKGCRVPRNRAVPDIKFHPEVDCVRILGKYLKIKDYEHNYMSFWILDVLSLVIKRCQFKMVSKKNQIRLIQWFIYIFKTLQFTNSGRREIFNDIDQMILKSGDYMIKNGTYIIPTPQYAKYLTILSEESDKSKVMFLHNSYTGGIPGKFSKESFWTRSSDQRLSKRKSARDTLSDTDLNSSWIEGESDTLRTGLLSEALNESEENKAILSDLVVVTRQIYFIFAPQGVHHILATLCRHPKEIKVMPLTRGLKCPLPVEEPSNPLYTTDCQEHYAKYNQICAEKAEILKTLLEEYEKEQENKDKIPVNDKSVKYKEDGSKDEETDSDSGGDEDFKLYLDDDSLIPWKTLFTCEKDYSYYDLDQVIDKKCNFKPYNDSVLPLKKAISDTYINKFVPIAFVEQAQASGDPEILDLKLALEKDESDSTQSDDMTDRTRDQIKRAYKPLLIQKERELNHELWNTFFDDFIKQLEAKQLEMEGEGEMYEESSIVDMSNLRTSTIKTLMSSGNTAKKKSVENSGGGKKVSLTKTKLETNEKKADITNTRGINEPKNNRSSLAKAKDKRVSKQQRTGRAMMMEKITKKSQLMNESLNERKIKTKRKSGIKRLSKTNKKTSKPSDNTMEVIIDGNKIKSEEVGNDEVLEVKSPDIRNVELKDDLSELEKINTSIKKGLNEMITVKHMRTKRKNTLKEKTKKTSTSNNISNRSSLSKSKTTMTNSDKLTNSEKTMKKSETKLKKRNALKVETRKTSATENISTRFSQSKSKSNSDKLTNAKVSLNNKKSKLKTKKSNATNNQSNKNERIRKKMKSV